MKKRKLKENKGCVAAEYLSEYYNILNTVNRLKKEIAFAVKQGAPKSKITASYDNNKGGYVAPIHDDALKTSAGILKKTAAIQNYLLILEEMTDTLGTLSADERLALIMRYVDDHPIKVICTELNYSSRQSVYSLLSTALEKFSRNWGFDA